MIRAVLQAKIATWIRLLPKKDIKIATIEARSAEGSELVEKKMEGKVMAPRTV